MSAYKLKRPIRISEGGAPITELVFRETIVAGDLRGIKMSGIQDPTTDDVLKIAGRLCAQPDVVMNKLELADFDSVLEIVGGFLLAGRQTGTEPSP